MSLQMWFLASGRLHSVGLLVPRSFLVDSTLPEPGQLAAELAAAAERPLQLAVARAAGVTVATGRRPVNLYRVRRHTKPEEYGVPLLAQQPRNKEHVHSSRKLALA